MSVITEKNNGFFDKASANSKERWNNTFGKGSTVEDNIQGATAALQGVQGVVEAFTSNSKIADTSALESKAKGLYNSVSNASTNDLLMSEWNSYIPMQKMSWRDIRGLKTGLGIMNTATGAAKGALAGASIGGPYGAAAGVIVGTLGGVLGWLRGNKKAKNQATKINRLYSRANLRGFRGLWDKTKAVENQKRYEMEANDYAFGGYMPIFGDRVTNNGNFNLSLNRWQGFVPLQTFARGGRININPENVGSFTREAKKRGLGVQEFANRVLSNKDNYPVSLIKKANFARNAANWNAFGGELNTLGADFTNGVIFVNQGGTHELNPLQGVPMGIAPDGLPNLVELGETVFNDYVFSNRIKIPKLLAKKYKLGGNLTFADASKKLSKESEERPNSVISKNGLMSAMSDLMAALEEIKMTELESQQQQAVVAAFGGKLPNMFLSGGSAYNKFTPPEIPPDLINLVKEGNLTWDSARNILNNYNTYNQEGRSYIRSQFPAYLNIDEKPEDIDLRKVFANEEIPYLWNNDKRTLNEVEIVAPKKKDLIIPKNVDTALDTTKKVIAPLDAINTYTPFAGLNNYQEKPQKNNEPEGIKYAPTWMRYAPIITNGAQVLKDLFTDPFYGNIERAEQAAYAIPTIGTSPAGGFKEREILDPNFDMLLIAAQNSAARNAALSLGNTNSANQMTNILAADAQALQAMANARKQARAAQTELDFKTGEFNNKILEDFYKRDLQALMANQQRGTAIAQQLLKTSQLRDNERIRVDDQGDENRGYFGKALGNLGTENWNKNNAMWAMVNDVFGVLPDTPLQDFTKNGWDNMRNLYAYKLKHGAAKGGKLRTRKKKGLTF